METLKAYALDFGKGLIAAVVAAALAYIADFDLAEAVAAVIAGGGLTAAGPKNRDRRKNLR